jgi:hypothetical protein
MGLPALGTLTLGGVSPRLLAEAGWIDEHTPGALDTAERLFRWPLTPGAAPSSRHSRQPSASGGQHTRPPLRGYNQPRYQSLFSKELGTARANP